MVRSLAVINFGQSLVYISEYYTVTICLFIPDSGVKLSLSNRRTCANFQVFSIDEAKFNLGSTAQLGN